MRIDVYSSNAQSPKQFEKAVDEILNAVYLLA